LSLVLLFGLANPLIAQDKTHSKKLEKVKKKKKKKKKDKRASQYPGKIEPTATHEIKGNPTKKTRKSSGKNYQERIGTGKAPRGTKGTAFTGKGKPKSVDKSKGTRHRGDPVQLDQKIAGNPTKKKQTSGGKYQERIGIDGPPKGTKGTKFAGRGKPKSIKANDGTNYKGDKIPMETTRIKGNPTKKVDKNAKGYLERSGQQGSPTGTDGTKFAGKGRPKAIKGGNDGTNFAGKGRPKAIKGGNDGTNFAGKGRPKTIKGGNDGTTYSGQSTAGSTSTAGGRSTIYGERGRNFKKSGAPKIEKREQGVLWKGNLKESKAIEGTLGTRYKGNLKGNKVIEGAPGTRFKGNMKVPDREIYDYGGDWAGDMKLKKGKPDTRASTYAIKGMRPKELPRGPGTTYEGSLRSSKKIVGWDGADFQGHLKVKPNQKVRTDGTKFAGNLKVRPNAKTKTPGTTFAGHYKVSTNSRIKTEGVDFQGNYKISTRFFKNRFYKKQSREQQLFAGNYKVRRTKGKDLHPSATYSGGRLKDPNKRDDFSRKFKLLIAKTQKNADQPKHLKNKGKKPKYDPKEREIWND